MQLAFVLGLAPLVLTLAKKVKASWQRRRGPPLLQGYYDALKLLRKGRRLSEHATPWTHLAPPVVLASLLMACLLLPLVSPAAPLADAGDLFLFLGFLALARFGMALAGLDAGGAFGGLGASRELTFASLVEPGLIASFLSLSFAAQSTRLDTIAAHLASDPPTFLGLLLPLAALLVLIVAETNRIPVDNPATHLELTMVHEAMVLEQSGPDLALMELANGAKHVALLGVVATVFVPWAPAWGIDEGLATALWTAFKILALIIVIATAESLIAKWRVFRVPELTTIAFVLAFLGFLGNLFFQGAA